MNSFTYISPAGHTITFGAARPWLWRTGSAGGPFTSSVSPVARAGPGQRGVTVVDVAAAPKTITFGVRISADTPAQLWEHRRTLARALALDPSRHGDPVALGTLQLFRDGQPAVETTCVPQESPAAEPRSHTALDADIEFYSPTGLWWEPAERTLVFEVGDSGLALPADLPADVVANAAVQELDSSSDVRTPLRVRFHGPATAPRLRNLTTGEVIAVVGSVDVGDHLEVDTAARTVTLVESGVASSALDRWAWGEADFYHLDAGVNRLAWENDAAGGSAAVAWRPHYSAV